MIDHLLVALDALLEDAPQKAPPLGLAVLGFLRSAHGRAGGTRIHLGDPFDHHEWTTRTASDSLVGVRSSTSSWLGDIFIYDDGDEEQSEEHKPWTAISREGLLVCESSMHPFRHWEPRYKTNTTHNGGFA
jgi:hypothetical protein